jgi:hypothetical protein
MSVADRKARLAAARASARRRPEPMLAGEPSDLPDWHLWMVGKAAVLVPKLLPGAPASIRRRYRLRIVVDATGECPRCGSIAADRLEGSDPLDGRAALSHEDDCPVLLVESEAERWLDPRARPLRGALASLESMQ